MPATESVKLKNKGGDIVNGNGYGGESIYSKNDKKSGEFDDESFALKVRE